jgi:LPXTG-motif cell wall-anchored protein
MITSHGTSNIGLIVAGVIAVLILAAAAILAVWMRRRSVSQQ